MNPAGSISTQFIPVLYDRVEDYFAARHIAKKGSPLMTFKVVAGLAYWLATYALIFAMPPGYGWFLAAYLLHATSHLFLFLNIGHDSNHGAISSSPVVNRVLSFSLDALGINSYLWRILHHRGHHSCINVYGEDEAILGRRLFRFSSNAPRRFFQRLQHWYALPFYGFASFDYAVFKDFEYFLASDYEIVNKVRHPFHEYIILFLGKLLYFGYMIALPSYVLGIVWWQAVLAFMAAHVLIGVISLSVFQTTHVIETTGFPRSAREFDNYVFHIFATTADYSTSNPVANFLLGGLNQHVVHHLWPTICHTHYPELTKIVKATASEFGVPYRENPTLFSALRQHLSLLKRLGNSE